MITIRNIPLHVESTASFWHVAGEIEGDIYDVDRVKIEPGDVIIDIGAHIGLFSCYVAAMHPKVLVEAFEPVPDTFVELRRNASHYPNIRTHNLAVDIKEEVVIQHRKEFAYCSSSHYKNDLPGAVKYTCPAISLDDVLRRYSEVKFLKIDCEGAEWDLLLNCTLLSRVKNIGMELHLLDEHKHKLPALKAKLREHFDERNFSVHIVDKENSEGLISA